MASNEDATAQDNDGLQETTKSPPVPKFFVDGLPMSSIVAACWPLEDVKVSCQLQGFQTGSLENVNTWVYSISAEDFYKLI